MFDEVKFAETKVILSCAHCIHFICFSYNEYNPFFTFMYVKHYKLFITIISYFYLYGGINHTKNCQISAYEQYL